MQSGSRLIAGVPYSVMDLYHVIPLYGEIRHKLLLSGSDVCSSSFLYGTWRYR